MEFWYRLLTYSLPAGRIAGIPLRLHWMLALFAAFAVSRPLLAGGGPEAALLVLGFLAILYGSILLHEFGHVYGMHLVGISVMEIQLTPLGGIAVGEGAPASPRAELIVVGLGPAVSLALCGLGFAIHAALAAAEVQLPGFLAALPKTLALMNLWLAGFNLLLPIFPLDGAKILRAALSLRYSAQRITYGLANFGIGLSLVLLLASFLNIPLPGIGQLGPVLWLIFLLGIQSCMATLKLLEFQRVYESEDTWGDRSVYLDDTVMEMARARLASDLRGVPFVGSIVARGRSASRLQSVPQARSRREKSTKAARVIAVAPDPERIDDPAELARMIREAADAEDFVLAQRLKTRLDQIRKQQGGTGSEP